MNGVFDKQAAAMPAVTIPELVRDLLRARGMSDEAEMHAFLNPNYDTDLADPFLMTDMNKAIARIVLAIERNEKVAVYGDYDIDGIVSTTLMLEVLQQQGLDPVSYIPDRYDEGYGIHITALEDLKAQGIDLVISVDCGITSVKEAEWATANGLDLVITDHHDAPEVLPRALAVVNPKRAGDTYPYKELAGVGVAFAVARALQARTGIPVAGREKWLLDLVALGTVCDVMTLTGENRVMVKYGLIVLRKTRRVGLVALAQSADVELASLRAYHLGFVFGPRLNAAGRLEHANYSLELMTTNDPIDAQALAFQLEELNHQRQLEQERITNEAAALAETYSDDPVLVLADSSWAHGIVGIVASKLAERYDKPTLILQKLAEHAKGSARSARGYNLIDGLRANEHLFTKVGGHHFAAGFTLPLENIDTLRGAVNAHYLENEASLPDEFIRTADLDVEDMAAIDWDFYNSLQQLEPFGSGNPQPCFGLANLKVVTVGTVGKTKRHLKCKLATPAGAVFEGIGFNLAEECENVKSGQTVNVLCYVQKNEWQDRVSLQLGILELH